MATRISTEDLRIDCLAFKIRYPSHKPSLNFPYSLMETNIYFLPINNIFWSKGLMTSLSFLIPLILGIFDEEVLVLHSILF